MHITLNTNSKAGRHSQHRLQARFDKLRKQLERQQNRNHKLATELEALAQRYQHRLQETDRHHLESLQRLAERLIVFFTRKSLSNWQRVELADWIGETLQRIGRVDTAAAEALQERFRQAAAEHLQMSEAEMDAEAEAMAEAVEEAFEELFGAGDDDPEADDPQPDLFEDRDSEFFDDDEADWHGPDPEAETRTRALMDGSWTRGLFRRAAQALHPDRETDPEQRRHKQALMQQLLTARDQGDLLTLLQLYAQAADNAELELAEAEMEQACALLEDRLEQLEDEEDEIIHAHPLRALVHELFYNPTRKTREQNFRAWEDGLRTDAETAARLPEELRNLGILKEYLELRRQRNMFSEFDDIIF